MKIKKGFHEDWTKASFKREEIVLFYFRKREKVQVEKDNEREGNPDKKAFSLNFNASTKHGNCVGI